MLSRMRSWIAPSLVGGDGAGARAMHEIQVKTEQSLAGAHRAERAAEELNELAGRLREAVARYRL
jgi:methyl-accepting chemotaxis protein